MHAAAPIPNNDAIDPLTVADDSGMSTNNSAGNTLINPMDIDQSATDTTSVFTSTGSFGKRKINAIAPDDELNISDKPFILPKLPTVTSAMPPRKKPASVSRSLPRSKNTSSTNSSQLRLAPPSTSAKMTPTLLAHEIQGSLNSLASAVRESGSIDPVSKLRQDAIHHVSDNDDGLTAAEKIALIDLFRNDYPAIQSYIALLQHDDLRLLWLEKQLLELQLR